MGKASISREKLSQIELELDKAIQEEKTNMTAFEVVSALYEKIEIVVDKHGHERVVNILKKLDLKITPNTLKQYISRIKKDSISKAN